MLIKNLLKRLIKLFRRRFKVFLLIIFLPVLSYLIYLSLLYAPFLKIKSIRVEGSTMLVSTSDIRSVLEEKYLGSSIFSLRKIPINGIISSNFPAIKEVSYKLAFPNHVVVNVEERVPFSYVKPTLQQSYYILDDESYVLGVTDEKNDDLAIIELSGSMVFAGNKIDEKKVITVVRFISEIDKLGIGVLSAKVNTSGIEITTSNPNVLVLISESINGQEAQKALLLYKVLQKYNIEGKAVKLVDLRFSNPIVDF